MVGMTLFQLPTPVPSAGAAPGAAGLPGTTALPTDAVPSAPTAGGGSESDPLGTVGIALLAYGLVQLLSKVVDKLPVWKGGGDPPASAAGVAGGGGFGADDRKRLERVLEQAMTDHQRLERLEESVREVLESTRWMAEMRARDPRDGEPVWACRARGMSDQLVVQQRLVGQSLDEVRAANARLDNVLRKLRALWVRVGRRRKDRG